MMTLWHWTLLRRDALQQRNREMATAEQKRREAQDQAEAALLAHVRHVKELKAQRVRQVPEKALPDKEVVSILGGIAESDVWRALHQELDAAIMDAVEDVSAPPDPNKPERSRDFAAGGVDYLRRLQARLIDISLAAQERDADLE